MPMRSCRPPLRLVLAFLLIAWPARAQPTGHDMAGMQPDSTAPSSFHFMGQAIPLLTRAAPTAGGVTHTEFNLTQALFMGRTAWWSGHAQLDVALNGEGLTMPNGELNTGAYGEGYVDRRHPHTYVHELMLTSRASTGPLQVSLSGGRGFASFGTDDPMMRPLVKFPINQDRKSVV